MPAKRAGISEYRPVTARSLIRKRRVTEKGYRRAAPRQIGERDVASAARTDRERRASAHRRTILHSVSHDRRRNHFPKISAAAPELATSLGILGLHHALPADDDFVVVRDMN